MAARAVGRPRDASRCRMWKSGVRKPLELLYVHQYIREYGVRYSPLPSSVRYIKASAVPRYIIGFSSSFFYCINGSHSRLLHPSLVASLIIKRRLPAESAGSLFWSVRVIRWRRPRFKGFAVSAGASGEPPKHLGGNLRVSFFLGEKKKGYKSQRGTTPRITDSHTHWWLPASRWVSRRNKSAPSSCWVTKPEGRDWYARPI